MSWSFLRSDLAEGTGMPSMNMHCSDGTYGQLAIRRLGHRTNNIVFPDDYAFKETLRAPKERHVKTPKYFPYVGKDTIQSKTQAMAMTAHSNEPEVQTIKATTTYRPLENSRTKVLMRARMFAPAGVTCKSLPPVGQQRRKLKNKTDNTLYRTANTARYQNVRLTSVTTGNTPVFIN